MKSAKIYDNYEVDEMSLSATSASSVCYKVKDGSQKGIVIRYPAAIATFKNKTKERIYNPSITANRYSINRSSFSRTDVESLVVRVDVYSGNSVLNDLKYVFGESNTNTYYHSEVFSGITNLKITTFGSSTTKIGRSAFDNTSLENIVIPTNISSLNVFCFANCSKLNTCLMHDKSSDANELSIYTDFLYGSNVSEIVLPSRLKNIQYSAFDNVPLKYLSYSGVEYTDRYTIESGITNNINWNESIDLPTPVAHQVSANKYYTPFNSSTNVGLTNHSILNFASDSEAKNSLKYIPETYNIPTI